MRKIKWRNVIKSILLLFFIKVILGDFYFIIFKNACFTWLGLFTHLLCWLFIFCIINDFEEQIKSIPRGLPKRTKDTQK